MAGTSGHSSTVVAVLTRYEACNFQDIAGQRIGKVIETLSVVDDHFARSASDGVAHNVAAG